MVSGIFRSSITSVDVRMAGWSKSNMGRYTGSDPVATMTLSASTVIGPSACRPRRGAPLAARPGWEQACPFRAPVDLCLLQQHVDVVAQQFDDPHFAVHHAARSGVSRRRPRNRTRHPTAPARAHGRSQEASSPGCSRGSSRCRDEVLLHQRDGSPMAGGSERSHIAARTGANYDKPEGGLAHHASAMAMISGTISSLPIAIMCTPSQTLLSRRKRMCLAAISIPLWSCSSLATLPFLRAARPERRCPALRGSCTWPCRDRSGPQDRHDLHLGAGRDRAGLFHEPLEVVHVVDSLRLEEVGSGLHLAANLYICGSIGSDSGVTTAPT